MYDGRTELEKGSIVGHEIMGVISEVGDAVRSIKKGDRVVLPFNIACGFCFNCHRGYTNACLTMNPESAGAGYGYAGMGPYQGGQAEFVLVPYADFNCLKLPGTPGDEWEDDFLLLADVFPTGYHAAELADVSAGKTVAIFGAGPVGLMAAYSSILKGASEVYVVDNIPERLEKAKEVGAMPIDFSQGDPVERIFEIRHKHRGLEAEPPSRGRKDVGRRLRHRCCRVSGPRRQESWTGESYASTRECSSRGKPDGQRRRDRSLHRARSWRQERAAETGRLLLPAS